MIRNYLMLELKVLTNCSYLWEGTADLIHSAVFSIIATIYEIYTSCVNNAIYTNLFPYTDILRTQTFPL